MIEEVREFPNSGLPEQSNEEWSRNYSNVAGADNLKKLFDQLRSAGYYPFRFYHWPTGQWYVSEKGAPPTLFLSPDEAEALTFEELLGFVKRWRAEWEWVMVEPTDCDCAEEGHYWSHGKWARIQ